MCVVKPKEGVVIARSERAHKNRVFMVNPLILGCILNCYPTRLQDRSSISYLHLDHAFYTFALRVEFNFVEQVCW